MAKTRRVRLIEAINSAIQSREGQQLGFEFVKPRGLSRMELIEIAIQCAVKLGSTGYSKSDKADYLAEVLTLSQLTGKGIGFISQKAVTGGKHYRGVAEHLRALEKAGVDIAHLTKILLTSSGDIRAIMQRLPPTYAEKKKRAIEREISKILFWHRKRLEGHERMQILIGWLRRKHESLYGTKVENAMLTREDVLELLSKGVPREDIERILRAKYTNNKTKNYVPRPKKVNRINRKPI
ncbi:MAG: hypothetical protein N3F05_01780 [Candidatus Diapherotrites archaeon]|nr:hypothetical protein [Candidatus Diapherotrites archaeon]